MNEHRKFYTSRAFVVFQIATFALTILIGTQLAANESTENEIVEVLDSSNESTNAYGKAVDSEDC